DLCGFRVTDLAYHDLVGIVPQYRAQAAGEGKAFLLIDGYLQHAGQLVFDRILDRHDLVVAVVDLADRRIQRGRLPAAGRPGDQQHAVRLLGQAAQLRNGCRLEAEQVKPQPPDLVGKRLLVQYAQHRVFAEDAGHDRHAHVDLATAVEDLESSVLRNAALRDIELGHHLDPRNHLFGELGAGNGVRGAEHSVETILDREQP